MGFLRRIFGRDLDASTASTGRVLTVDTSVDSGLKWASPLPTPASTDQVLRSTGDAEGDFAWGADFDLPAAASSGQVLTATGTDVGDYAWGDTFNLPAATSSGQVLTATGTGVGDYAWGAAPSNLWFASHAVYEVPGTYTFTAAAGQVIRILLIAPGRIGYLSGSISSVTENSNQLLEAYPTNDPGATTVGYAFFDVSKISPISVSPGISLYFHPLFTVGNKPGYAVDGDGNTYAGGWIDTYYRNTTGGPATLAITVGQGRTGSGAYFDGGCILQYN